MRVFLDDVREPRDVGLSDDWVIVRTVRTMCEFLKSGNIVEVSLDHDLGENQENGYYLVCWMELCLPRDKWPKIIRLHTANPVGRQNMERALRANGIEVTR